MDVNRIKRLVIDPGHGGKASGVVYGELREADAALATALTLKYILTDRLEAPFEIVLTRATDAFTPFHRRTGIPADLMLSLHYDVEWGHAPIYWQKNRCDSYYVARRLKTLADLDNPLWPTSRAAHTGGRLYIDDAVHPAILMEVDRIDRYKDEAAYRLKKMTPVAKALIDLMEEM